MLLWKLTHNRLFRISLIITTENILSWNIAGSRRSAAGLTGCRSKLIVGLTLMMKQKQLLLICRNDELWKTGSHFNEHIYRESQYRSVHTDNSEDLPNYREADYFPVFLSHLGQKTRDSWEICATNIRNGSRAVSSFSFLGLLIWTCTMNHWRDI